MTAKEIKDRYLVPAVIALAFGAGGGWAKQQTHDAVQDVSIHDIAVRMDSGFTTLNAKIDTLGSEQRQLYCLTVPSAYRAGCTITAR